MFDLHNKESLNYNLKKNIIVACLEKLDNFCIIIRV